MSSMKANLLMRMTFHIEYVTKLTTGSFILITFHKIWGGAHTPNNLDANMHDHDTILSLKLNLRLDPCYTL